VIVVGDDLYGDGVNVAARLETLAQPGGICISDAVREQVGNKLDVEVADMGEQSLKNIARPVHVFRLAIDGQAGAAPGRPSLPLPDKPSIAVLPFANLSGDPEQDYFADGMVEDIITGLSRIKWVFVIARNSSFVYKGKAMDVKQVGRELGVRYVLEGSVRKSSNRVRITAQLIDAGSGSHIWADRYDRALDDIFAVQDELTISVVGVIEPTLRQVEIERARRKRPDSLDAYDLYLRALPFAFTAMPQDADEALTLLQRAVELEPGYAAAHAIIAWCHEQRYLRGGLHEETRTAALDHARKALAMGSDDAGALATAGFVVAVVESDYETATAAFDRSFALSSSSALALGFSSIVSAWMGENEKAVEQAGRAIRLSPFDPLIYLPYVGLAYAQFAAGRFAEAAAAAGHASHANPKFSMPYVLQAAALANLGRGDEAGAVIRRLGEVDPGLTVATAIRSSRYANPDKNAGLGQALRRAGLPE
jgi:TolB-like protein